MPRKVQKPKQKKGGEKPVKKQAKKAVQQPAKRKRVAKKNAKPVLRPAKLEFIPHVKHVHAPAVRKYLGLQVASWLLILSAALTNSIAVMAAGVDMERYETEAAVALSQQPQPQAYLHAEAERLGYNANLLHRIAFCESGWRMVKNSKSSAYGYFQIIDATERHTPQYIAGQRKFDPYANIDMALYLYGRYGSAPWTESQGCWGR